MMFPQQDESLAAAERIRLMRDATVNLSGRLVSIAAAIVLVPLMLDELGTEQYGAWIAAFAAGGILASLDFGLGWSLTRAAALTHDEDVSGSSAAAFVATGATTYGALGLAGGLILAVAGLPLSRAFHLSPDVEDATVAVFGLAGVAFFGDRILSFADAVLTGLRRFHFANTLTITVVLARTLGIVVLLKLDAGIESLAVWQASVSLVAAATTVTLINHLERTIRIRFLEFDWGVLRKNAPFGLASQVAAGAIKVMWDIPSILIGVLRGSAAIVPYYVGQRLPFAVSGLSYRIAEVVFPVASQQEGRRDTNAARAATIEVGTRSTLVLAVPAAVILLVFGSHVLDVWLGESDSTSVWVLRWTTIAVAIDAAAAAALHALWARGEMRALITTFAGASLMSVGLTPILLNLFGVAGVAFGVLVSVSLASVSFLVLVARPLGVSGGRLSGTSLSGFLPATAVAFSAALILEAVAPGNGWNYICMAASVTALAFGLTFYFTGAHPVERMLIREILLFLPRLGQRTLRLVRRALRRVWILRNSWHLLKELRETYSDNPARNRELVEREFDASVDPWNYESVTEQNRFQQELRMIDAARNGRKFRFGLEIGCAEGAFTTFLATRCVDLLAVDLSETALDRARRRASWSKRVQFAQFDVRTDVLEQSFDLIVVEHVLEYVARPSVLRRARSKIVDALEPGGYLLVGDVRHAISERAWWGQPLIRGGKWITELFADEARLRLVAHESDERFVEALFEKTPGLRSPAGGADRASDSPEKRRASGCE